MKNQNQRVLDHLINHGYITQVIASNYGIRRLAARILDLKKENITIVSETKYDDSGSRYAYYRLPPNWRKYEKSRRKNGFCYRSGRKFYD